MALKVIKNKIRATERTGKVTKAMEAVSAVKMRKSQELALSGREYAHAALRMLENLSASREGLKHPFARKREEGKSLVVAVTSDKGLAGNVNSAVLKLVDEYLKDHEDTEFVCVGKKARDHAQRCKKHVCSEYLNFSDNVTLESAERLAKEIVERYQSSEYRVVKIIYQNFLSTFEQQAVARTILPLNAKAIHEIIEGITPRRGKFSHNNFESKMVTYTIEPNEEEVLEMLIPKLATITVYHALVESKACEHSARMVAMKNASDKAKEITRDLTLQFNKERQAVITREVSEITGGIEAMANT